MRLLLIEDDAPLGSALQAGLQQSGHDVLWLQRANGVEPALLANVFDAVLLDLSLPDADGRALLRAMRARRDRTPVVVVSARGQPSDRITLLDDGADDYLVKPVDLGELEARLRAVMRRGRGETNVAGQLQHGALRVDTVHGGVTWQGRRVHLRERERWLLELFLHNPERTFSREQVEAEMYQGGQGVDSNAIEVHLHHLRKRLSADVVTTVRGVGYRLGPALGDKGAVGNLANQGN